jgi:ribonuclease I
VPHLTLRILVHRRRPSSAKQVEAFALESKTCTLDEREFLVVHGYWPEATDVAERIEGSFTTRGLKTTIIWERVEPAKR